MVNFSQFVRWARDLEGEPLSILVTFEGEYKDWILRFKGGDGLVQWRRKDADRWFSFGIPAQEFLENVKNATV